MPRALKTYITNLGFFELAIAAPSMKAALEAWGMNHNAFKQGFAKETDDPRIIAAATAQPGVVLKRAVGSKDEFGTDARLPTSLPNIRPPRIEAPKARKRVPAKAKPDRKASRADIISFEKARARRDKERAAAEAKAEKERAARQRATDAAEAALEKARQRHEAALAAIAGEQEKLERREHKERERWEFERKKLQAAVDKAER
jgi:colicin import membrane protein